MLEVIEGDPFWKEWRDSQCGCAPIPPVCEFSSPSVGGWWGYFLNLVCCKKSEG